MQEMAMSSYDFVVPKKTLRKMSFPWFEACVITEKTALF